MAKGHASIFRSRPVSLRGAPTAGAGASASVLAARAGRATLHVPRPITGSTSTFNLSYSQAPAGFVFAHLFVLAMEHRKVAARLSDESVPLAKLTAERTAFEKRMAEQARRHEEVGKQRGHRS